MKKPESEFDSGVFFNLLFHEALGEVFKKIAGVRSALPHPGVFGLLDPGGARFATAPSHAELDVGFYLGTGHTKTPRRPGGEVIPGRVPDYRPA